MGKLDGKVALITGADSGIGQGTAVEFAKEGADVLVNYLHDEQGAQSTRKQVEQVGRRAVVVQGDVGAEADVIALVEAARMQLGGLDVLVNSAGVDASGTQVATRRWPTSWPRCART